jgi:hypothetical protein
MATGRKYAQEREIGRFEPQLAGATDEGFLPMDQMAEGEWVRFEDHRRLLLAAEGERDEWRGKAEHRLHEWRLRVDDAAESEAIADEAKAAKEMWRDRAEKAEKPKEANDA